MVREKNHKNKIYYLEEIMKKFNVAVVGASGLVGRSILKVLEEEDLLKCTKLSLFVSDKSAGEKILVDGNLLTFEKLNESAKKLKFDVVFMTAGDEVSLNFAESFAESGAYVIDNTNAFRRRREVPLVVPEINSEKIDGKSKIISNPNCSTIQLVLALDKLRHLSKIKQVVVSTYQSVSGAGSEALSDLKNGTNFAISEGITNNVVAKIGEILRDGFCTEEDKIMFETCKILQEDFPVCATAVRVPIPYCHTESVLVEFEKPVCLKKAKELLECNYLKVSNKIILPNEVAETNTTFVSRLRAFGENGLAFVVTADNLRRGASFNAVKIFEELLSKKLL